MILLIFSAFHPFSRLDRDHLRRQQEGSAYEIFRPGFTRISISYHASHQEAEYISEAVQLIAAEGWKLLPLYIFNPETGEFFHHTNHVRVLTLNLIAICKHICLLFPITVTSTAFMVEQRYI